MRVYDLTQDNQLSSVTGMVRGLFLAGAYPYLVDGIVYPPSFEKYEDAAAYQNGYSMLNWEPETDATSYSTGFATVSSGVVDIPGATLPSDFPFNVIAGRFCIGSSVYDVASRDSNTQLTLVDTSVNVPVAAPYKFSRWDYREIDPKYAFNAAEWQYAHDEYAFALEQIKDAAIANNAHVGIYKFLACTYRRANHIIDDLDAGLYEEWQDNIATVCGYVTASGFTLLEFLQDVGGLLLWPNYVPNAYLFIGGNPLSGPSEINKTRWRLRNTRIIETFDGIGIPHAPLFLRHSVEGIGGFYATGTGTEIPDSYQQEMIDDTGENGYAWWAGDESPTYGYPMTGYTFPAESFAAYQTAQSTAAKRRSAAGIVTPGAEDSAAKRRDVAGDYGPLAEEAEQGFNPAWARGSNVLIGVG